MEEHLVCSQGKYYLSTLDPALIEKYSDECGSADFIVVTYTKGHLVEALIEYFNELAYSFDCLNVGLNYELGIEDINDALVEEYNIERNMIKSLVISNIITKEEGQMLFRHVDIGENKQFDALRCLDSPSPKFKIKSKKIIN